METAPSPRGARAPRRDLAARRALPMLLHAARPLVVAGAVAVLLLGAVRVVGEGHALFPGGVTGWAFAALTVIVVGHLVALGHGSWWGGTGSGAALTLAILLLYGWVPAALVSLALVTLTSLIRRGRWAHALTHGSCDLLGIGAAALTLGAWGTWPSVTDPWSPDQWQLHTMPELLAAAGSYLVVNRLLLWCALAPPGAVPTLARAALLRHGLVATALLALAPLIVVVAASMPVLLPLFAVPLIALDSMLWIARARTEEQLLDPLTGLPNRQWLLERVRAALEDAERAGGRCALILIDLDRFRSVNDTLGHLTGDRLLLQIADRVAGALPRGAETARLGGDEFAVLLPDVPSVSSAQRVAREVVASLGAPVRLDGLSLVVEASAGVAVFPDHTHSTAHVPSTDRSPSAERDPSSDRSPSSDRVASAARPPAPAVPPPASGERRTPVPRPTSGSRGHHRSAPRPASTSARGGRAGTRGRRGARGPVRRGSGQEAEALLRRADVAMYEAKSGRGGVEVYDLSRDGNTPDRLGLLGDLRQALDHRQVELHYQPKVRFDGTVAGVEALLRWNHPTRGRVPPDEFIAIAESSGLMPRLTDFVLEEALGQVARWRAAGITVPVAVNVSPRDVYTPGFAGAVAGRLARHGVPAASLQLEITEHVMLEDPQQAADTLAGLIGHGVRMSLDDFGTGYSSLVHLRRLPVSELKIDRSFVARLVEDNEDAEIVRCTVELAHSLGLLVVAEGVEDTRTWERLREFGCDAVQGWLISAALPAPEATDWLRDQEQSRLRSTSTSASTSPSTADAARGPAEQIPGPAPSRGTPLR